MMQMMTFRRIQGWQQQLRSLQLRPDLCCVASRVQLAIVNDKWTWSTAESPGHRFNGAKKGLFGEASQKSRVSGRKRLEKTSENKLYIIRLDKCLFALHSREKNSLINKNWDRNQFPKFANPHPPTCDINKRATCATCSGVNGRPKRLEAGRCPEGCLTVVKNRAIKAP